MTELAEEYGGAVAKVGKALLEPPIWFGLAGVLSAWFFYMKRPDIPLMLRKLFSNIYGILDRKYGFDEFNDWFFAGGSRGISRFLWKFGYVKLIDGMMVNGTAKAIGVFSGLLRRFQTGYIYHYAFSMIIGVFVLLTVRNWFD
jgi:NADH-quinone oxidoreductase subunit L